MRGKFHGIITALITPFTTSGEIDWPAYKKLLAHQVESGVSGVVSCGTTGETPCLTLAEKKQLIEVTLADLQGTGVKVIAGTGSNNTAETVEFSIWADQQKVDGILVVTPYYNKPSQTGLEAHFKAVANSVECDVILYNVPARTGVSLSVETITRLSAHEQITTLKEASGNVALTSEILSSLQLAGTELDILSGDDATFLALLSIGAVGTISVASNLFPGPLVALKKTFDMGDTVGALKLHQHFYPLVKDLFIDSNPVPVKYCMSLLGRCEPNVRAPLAPLSPVHQKLLQETMKRCGL